MAYPPLLPPGYLAATGGTDLLESCASDLGHGSGFSADDIDGMDVLFNESPIREHLDLDVGVGRGLERGR
jgi:hypothetical protein